MLIDSPYSRRTEKIAEAFATLQYFSTACSASALVAQSGFGSSFFTSAAMSICRRSCFI